MAVTQIHPIETTLHLAIDYILNPEKTDEKLLVTGLNCTPEMAAFEFDMTKKNADKTDGRLGYHLIQSFKPGEVDYAAAHEIGVKLAEKLLGGNFETCISTHIDKGHIHNHIIFNSVSHKTHGKFNAPADIFHRIERESDSLCREYGLSVIEEKSGNKSKTYKEYSEDKQGTSWKSKLRETIDKNIAKAQSWDEFLALMEADKYEFKHGKLPKFRAPEQEKFTKLRTLGDYYTEEKIRERIAGKVKIFSGAANIQTEKRQKKEQHGISLLVDIENNIKVKQSAGYERWALINNIKMIAKTTNYITEHGLTDYGVLTAKHGDIKNKRDFSQSRIKEVEARISELKKQIEVLDNYRKYKPVVEKLDSVVFKDKYRREHESEFILFNAAKQNLKVYFPDGKKLPLIKDLRAELNSLYPEKNNLYSDYYTAKNELKELDVIKKNVDMILDKSPEHEKKTRSKNRGELE